MLENIGKAHGKSAAQVCLRYLTQQGIVVIPRTSKVERLAENFAIWSHLCDAGIREIAGLAYSGGRIVDCHWSPKVGRSFPVIHQFKSVVLKISTVICPPIVACRYPYGTGHFRLAWRRRAIAPNPDQSTV